MKSVEEIQKAIDALKARQQEVLSFYEDFPGIQRFTDGRDRVTLHMAAQTFTRWQEEINQAERAIALLRWTLGEIGHLPWR